MYSGVSSISPNGFFVTLILNGIVDIMLPFPYKSVNLKFTIWDEGEPYVFPKDMEAYLLGERPDGCAIAKKIIKDIDFNNNKITYLIEKDVI